MPCPYFLPKEPLKETGWAVPPRAPLGVLCAGECHAGGEIVPADHERCNFGYARGVCSRFPADALFDAVRFWRDQGSVRYVLERDHAPCGHGEVSSSTEPILAAQARMFAPSG